MTEFCPKHLRETRSRSTVCHEHCMTVTSVLYRSAVGRSTIPYCNSDAVIKVGGRQVGSVKKLYDRHVTNLQVGVRQVGNSVHRTCIPPTCLLPTCLSYTQYLSIADLQTVYLPSYSLVSADCLPVYRRPVNLFSPHCTVFVSRRPVYRLPVFLFLCMCQLTDCLPPSCPPIL